MGGWEALLACCRRDVGRRDNREGGEHINKHGARREIAQKTRKFLKMEPRVFVFLSTLSVISLPISGKNKNELNTLNECLGAFKPYHLS